MLTDRALSCWAQLGQRLMSLGEATRRLLALSLFDQLKEIEGDLVGHAIREPHADRSGSTLSGSTRTGANEPWRGGPGIS